MEDSTGEESQPSPATTVTVRWTMKGTTRPSVQSTHGARNTRSWDYVARTMVAGGVAGITAKTAIAPLDRVKILFQASNPHYEKYAGTLTGVFRATRDIQRTVGLRGLFQGNSATVLRIFPYAAIKFMAYEQYRSLLMPTRIDETPFKKLIAGSMAGKERQCVTSVFFTYPLDLFRVRLAFNTEATSYLTLANKIYNEPTATPTSFRMSNFYRGFLCSVVGMIPYAGVSFFTHDIMQDYCRKNLPWTLKAIHSPISGQPSGSRDIIEANSRPELLTTAELACGGIAGAVSMTAAYPFEVIRRRMQVAGAMEINKSTLVDGIWDTAKRIYFTKGPRGFFVGLSIGYLKVTPMVALSFAAYEKMKILLKIN
ncbi:mitochondrial carrier domain-containing protein [Lobosporangium transversale]|uniref:Mitochondrial carrier domain-containing protein n=1 Tax=Lobosporangium transversale TaxID=64571 RepID=A0A1Y2GXL1_9FUNG|nr:mitochondrial carrier domain-containing protein [Lobosporangium transversale]ORZ27029.1 mitochondrial carrier domain-containing protein [Lobosporangium transversale]|eukprot:XP_021884776.1 mitochondrial carrier domain-containing protein [Lobosporangium transversale]